MKLQRKIYGYHWTDTKEYPEKGIFELEEYCRNNNIPLYKIMADKCSEIIERPRYTALKNSLSFGDILIINEMGHLGRDSNEVIEEYTSLEEKGIIIMSLDQENNFIYDYEF